MQPQLCSVLQCAEFGHQAIQLESEKARKKESKTKEREREREGGRERGRKRGGGGREREMSSALSRALGEFAGCLIIHRRLNLKVRILNKHIRFRLHLSVKAVFRTLVDALSQSDTGILRFSLNGPFIRACARGLVRTFPFTCGPW